MFARFISFWLTAFIAPFILGSVAWVVFQFIGGPLGALAYWTVWGISFLGVITVNAGNSLSELGK